MMKRTAQNRFKALTSACVLTMTATVAWSQQPSITWLGVLPRGRETVAHGVSQDGNVVVGIAVDENSRQRAFRWTRTGGFQDLGTFTGGTQAVGLGVAANGSVVVGWAGSNSYSMNAFRWSSGSMQELRFNAVATSVSSNGAAVAGYLWDSSNAAYQAFRWTQAGGVVWITSGSGRSSYARGISLDGTVVVGEIRSSETQNRFQAFRRKFPGDIEILGTLEDGNTSVAYAASGDGSVVVGRSENQNGYFRPFRWTPQTGMVDLGTLGGNQGEARAVSGDGSVVVGWANDAFGVPRAFRWIAGRGMENLNEVYANLLTDGSELLVAHAISPNGRYIVGSGFNAATARIEGFLLDTAGTTGCRLDADVNRDGRVDDADLLQVLFSFGSGC
jgi:probable HAF family extracellular repeat protein